jgi:hypothetical protein
MPKLTACTKEEFDAFVATYSRRLDRDVYCVCEPPLITYNDFSFGDWPDSVVASYSAGDHPGDELYFGPPSNFKIAKDAV